MAVPKRRQSRSRRNNRRHHITITRTPLVRCSNCGANIRPHTICNDCGFYRGRHVLMGQQF